jgi:putative FmdB family regulatory protein
MPIYAYRCDECGFTKDVLQKISDAPLTDCPSCSKPAFKKQITAAGFQLKGTGWYVTDFRGGSSSSSGAKSDSSPAPSSGGDSSK